MAQFIYKITLGNGEVYRSDEEFDEVFDSEEEADDAALQALGEMDTGAEVLHLSNPGDYPYRESDYTNATIEVIKL